MAEGYPNHSDLNLESGHYKFGEKQPLNYVIIIRKKATSFLDFHTSFGDL